MVMRHDQGAGISGEGLFKDFSGIDGCVGNRPPKKLLALNQMKAGVEVEAEEDLMWQATNFGL